MLPGALGLLGTLGIWVLVASTGHAAVLEYTGTYGVRFSNFGGFEVTQTGTGVAIVNGPGGSLGALNSLELITPFAEINTTVPVTDPTVSILIPEIQLDGVKINPAVQGGLFAPISAVAGNPTQMLSENTLPGAGVIRLCQVIGCATAISQTLSQTVSGMAIGAGIGGSFTIGGAGPTRITVIGAPWTVNTATVSNRTPLGGLENVTAMGFAQGPAAMSGSTAQVGGMVQLVTATQTTSIGIPGNNDISGQLTRVTLQFTPEPGVLLLFASGALGVLVIGRRRIRS
ncbi:MAG: PEP-CTERM sorting domain-containing protein [Myxococcota bacterium]